MDGVLLWVGSHGLKQGNLMQQELLMLCITRKQNYTAYVPEVASCEPHKFDK